MNGHLENEQFARLIASLEPWLTNVVIIGGGHIGCIAFTPTHSRLRLSC